MDATDLEGMPLVARRFYLRDIAKAEAKRKKALDKKLQRMTPAQFADFRTAAHEAAAERGVSVAVGRAIVTAEHRAKLVDRSPAATDARQRALVDALPLADGAQSTVLGVSLATATTT
jgi:hypothetical protein